MMDAPLGVAVRPLSLTEDTPENRAAITAAFLKRTHARIQRGETVQPDKETRRDGCFRWQKMTQKRFTYRTGGNPPKGF